MRVLLCASLLLIGSIADAAKRDDPEVSTVRAPQAELRGRPSLAATVMGLVRRGETVEVVRTSSDRRWVQVEIGGGELAWIESSALDANAAPAALERAHTLRTPRDAPPRNDERRSDEWRSDERRNDERRNDERRNDERRSDERRAERADDDPPRHADRRREDEPAAREIRDDRPSSPKREPAREVRNEPALKREPAREVRNEPAPKREPSPPREPVLVSARPLRDIPAAKPGQLFAADLDDERPPSGPARK